jgi:hypothetical protein
MYLDTREHPPRKRKGMFFRVPRRVAGSNPARGSKQNLEEQVTLKTYFRLGPRRPLMLPKTAETYPLHLDDFLSWH